MKKYVKQLQQELEDASFINKPVFEIEVLTRKGERDRVVCDVFFRGNSLIAQRDELSTEEEKNTGYQYCEGISVDSCFTLDEHLQRLYEKVIKRIEEGDLYTLADNDSLAVVTKEDVGKAYDAAFAAWNKYIKLKREYEDGNS